MSAIVPFLARLERFGRVDSTQRIVRGWLDEGTPEVCVAVANEQAAGRGRQGRSWQSPPGAALLVSVGLRPVELAAAHGWRLGAVVGMAMLEAAEGVAGLPRGALGLKWPNDLVANRSGGSLRKVAGVLGEAVLVDGRVDSAVVGVGVNADWPAAAFPADLAASMTSLRALARDRPIDRAALLDAYLVHLEQGYDALRQGRFDTAGWADRQRTTGRSVEVDLGGQVVEGHVAGVDPESGALIVATAGGRSVAIGSGEVVRCRVVERSGG